MTDLEVQRALGYTPCVCGDFGGSWHSKCYYGLSREDVEQRMRSAMAKAKQALKRRAGVEAAEAIKVLSKRSA